jgi:hypothetical protein
MEDRLSNAIPSSWRPDAESIKDVLMASDALARLSLAYPEYEQTWTDIALDLRQRARRAVTLADEPSFAKVDLAA